MEKVIHKFRTAVGGFHRQDVLDYIESTDAAHRQQLQELQSRLDESEKARAELEDAMSGLQDEHGSMSAEEARVRAALEESTRTLSQLRGELTQKETALAAARQEVSRLREQVSCLEPMAKDYEDLKDRVAFVELDAHKKAQATMSEAEAEAEQIRQNVRQWLSGILGQYDRMCQALGEMEGHIKAVEQLSCDIRTDGGEAAQRMREWGGLE